MTFYTESLLFTQVPLFTQSHSVEIFNRTTDAQGLTGLMSLEYQRYVSATVRCNFTYTVNIYHPGYQSKHIKTLTNRYNGTSMNWTISLNKTHTITLHELTTNISGTHQSGFNGSGFNVFYNGSSIVHLFHNLINASGTLQAHWSGNYQNIWANDTGVTTPVTLHDAKTNTTGTLTNVLNAGGWDIYSNHIGNTTPINLFHVFTNCWGSYGYQLLAGGYRIDANITGNASSCNSTNLTVNENNQNISGGYTTYYDPLTGWMVNNTYNGLNGITLFPNFIDAYGTLVSSWNGTHHHIFANVTGNPCSPGVPLIVFNPNPANSSSDIYPCVGINTCIDISYSNFTKILYEQNASFSNDTFIDNYVGHFPTVTKLTDTTFLLVFRNYTVANENGWTYTRAGRINNNGTITFGPLTLVCDVSAGLSSHATGANSVARINDTAAIIIYKTYHGTYNIYAKIATIASDLSITFGMEGRFDVTLVGEIFDRSIIMLNSTQFVLTYLDVFNNICLVTGMVNGDDIINYGSSIATNDGTNMFSYMNIHKIDENSFLLNFLRGPFLDDCYFVVGHVSGISITYGSEYKMDTHVWGSQVAMVDETDFVIYYYDSFDIKNYIRSGSISGTTVSFGSAQYLADTHFYLDIVALADDSFMVAYYNSSNFNASVVFCKRNSPTSFTFYDEYNFDTGEERGYFNIIMMDASKFLVVYENNTIAELSYGGTGMCVAGNIGAVDINFTSNGPSYGKLTAYLNGTYCTFNDNFSCPGETYFWNVSATDGVIWENKSYQFSTVPKEIIIQNPSPANESIGVAYNRITGLITSVNIDFNAFCDSCSGLDVILSSNSSGLWLPYYSTTLSSAGTIYKQNSNFSKPGKTYWWKVTAVDTGDPGISEEVIYHFTTIVRPYGSVRVYGTEYSPGESGTIYAQILYEDGTPANFSSPSVTIWEKTSKYIDSAPMGYITGSNGCYFYNFVVPINISVFLSEVKSDIPYCFGSGEFHVSEWSSAIPRINDTVNNINATVHSIYEMLSYINTTYNPSIEATINDLYSLCSQMNNNLSAIQADWNYLYNYVWEIYNMSLYLNNTIWSGHIASEITDVLNYINNTRWDGYNISDIYNIVDSIENIVLNINTTTTTVITSQLNNLSVLCNNINTNLTETSIDVDLIYSLVYDSYNISLFLNSSWAGGNLSTNILNVLNYINDTRWDGFNASDIYNISNSIENIVTYINTTTVSLGNGFTVVLTDFGEIIVGKSYLAQVTVFDSDGTMMNADLSPLISLYDSAGNIIINNAAMNWISTGQYSYSYLTVAGQPSGQWTTIVKTIVHGNTVKNIEYWELEANPPEVTLTVLGTCFPSIDALIKIKNEGASDQEYFYYWWITPRADGDYVDGDTVDSGSASKLIAPLATFLTTKTLTVPSTGTYWYKVRVYYGTEWSAASAMFTAVTCGGVGPGGGGGIGGRLVLSVLAIDQDGKSISDAKIDIFDGERFIGSELTNETGYAVFGLPSSMTITIKACKDGYMSAEKTVLVSKKSTETIQLTKIGLGGFPWLWILIIIGTAIVILWYYHHNTKEKRRKTITLN